jgi:kumamolisin
MASNKTKRSNIEGSERTIPRGAKAVGKSDPDQRTEITIMLRPRPAAAAPVTTESLLSKSEGSPAQRQYSTRESFANDHGADAADIDAIERFAHDHDLAVTYSSPAERLVRVSGTLKDLSAAFKANVKQYRLGKNVFRGRSGSLSAPPDIVAKIAGVFGFDTRPAARPHFRVLGASEGGKSLSPKKAAGKSKKKSSASGLKAAAAATGRLVPFTAPEVAKLYNFPAHLDGSGQCIGLIELNSYNQYQQLGTGYSAADLKKYFAKLKVPMPKITAVGVAGGSNLPNIDPDSDVEVMLDVEVAGAVAPGAKIAVYFGPNTGKGFVDVLSAAVHDNVHKPSVISISWGGPEDIPYTTKQQRDGLEQILQDAAQLGITVCCSAGDDGSNDQPLTDAQGNPARDGKPHVDFPASSAFALACGGTTLTAKGNAIAGEVTWNEGDPKRQDQPSGSTGGGVSNIFPLPSYQAPVTVPKSPSNFKGRGVPDVSGNADSATGYLIKIAQRPELIPVGGTSAVAPLWAGLIALINQRLTALHKPHVGLAQPTLYKTQTAFRDITAGNNDVSGKLHKYKAGDGWDPCTGLGSPNGALVLKALGG